MDQSIIDSLIETAKKKIILDEYDENGKSSDGEFFNPYDIYGGQPDDAFYGGMENGEVQMARDLLDKMKIDWK